MPGATKRKTGGGINAGLDIFRVCAEKDERMRGAEGVGGHVVKMIGNSSLVDREEVKSGGGRWTGKRSRTVRLEFSRGLTLGLRRAG